VTACENFIFVDVEYCDCGCCDKEIFITTLSALAADFQFFVQYLYSYLAADESHSSNIAG